MLPLVKQESQEMRVMQLGKDASPKRPLPCAREVPQLVGDLEAIPLSQHLIACPLNTKSRRGLSKGE